MGVRTVKRFRSEAGMARFAAGLLRLELASRGRLSVALPGGKTPAALFKELAGAKLRWDRAVFLMSDERKVPLASPLSNFGAARLAFFSPAKVPASSLRPARSAVALRKAVLGATSGTGRLDLVFLGLGTDGHTASLFPGSRAWSSKNISAEVSAPAGITPRSRVTLTPAAIEKARIVVLLASGPGKKEIFDLASTGNSAIPAGRLRPRGRFYLLFAERD